MSLSGLTENPAAFTLPPDSSVRCNDKIIVLDSGLH
jgi:hypothetical protein